MHQCCAVCATALCKRVCVGVWPLTRSNWIRAQIPLLLHTAAGCLRWRYPAAAVDAGSAPSPCRRRHRSCIGSEEASQSSAEMGAADLQMLWEACDAWGDTLQDRHVGKLE